MTNHLKGCKLRLKAIDDLGFKPLPEILHVVVSGRYMPEYFLHLEVQLGALLSELDDYLRDIWLECCGHLSCFTIGGVSYESQPAEDAVFDTGARTMEVLIGRVLRPGVTCDYEYDYGSTTHLKLRVVDRREGAFPEKSVELIAQNDPLSFNCATCGNVAELVCPMCMWKENPFYCENCADNHADEDGDYFLLPIVNSPRTGVCGYTGELV